MFDDSRRSTVLWQLRDICSHDLIGKDELERFSKETRKLLALLDS
jgi:hypothetical protein